MFDNIRSLCLGLFEWSSKDKGELIIIDSPSQLRFTGSEFSMADLTIVRTTQPISQMVPSFYFEAKIIDSGKEGVIAVGLTQSSPKTRKGHFPGWNTHPTLGIGYHGDETEEGGIYHESSQPIERGESFTTGDVVGCYVNHSIMNGDEITLVQFTKNGSKIFSTRIITNEEWYPTIGLGSPGIIIQTNFDSKSSRFDVKGKYNSECGSLKHILLKIRLNTSFYYVIRITFKMQASNKSQNKLTMSLSNFTILVLKNQTFLPQ